MKTNKQKTDALQVFGRILTKENITLVVDKNATTGTFNLHKRILTIPEWSFENEYFTKMLMAHECAHAIFTPYDRWMDFIRSFDKDKMMMAKSYANIVEDCRIDRMMQERYSGLRQTYTLSSKYEMEKDFFKLKKDPNQYDFINRLNLHFKTHFYNNGYNLRFSAEEQVYVDRVAKLMTWDEVEEITREMIEKFPLDKSKDNLRNLDEFEESVKETEASEEEERKKKALEKGRYNFDEDSFEEKEESVEDDENTVTPPGIAFGVETYENLIRNASPKPNIAISYNVASGTKILKEPKKVEIKSLSYSSTETDLRIKTKNVIQDYKPWVSLFCAKFDQKKRAREVQKTMLSRTGSLDIQKLHLYQIADDVFKTNTVEERQQNHGFVALIDCSSSMTEIFHKVVEQFYATYAVCRRLNIPFKGYGFTTARGNNDATKGLASPFNSYGSLKMYNFFDTSKNVRYNENVLDFLLSGKIELGGTPLSDAIFNMIPHVVDMKVSKGIDIVNLIVLTDGGDGSSGVSSYLNINNTLVKTGLSTRGNFDNTHALYKYMRIAYDIRVTTIDITDNMGAVSNISSKSVSDFDKKGQTLIEDHGGASNCVMIKEANATSKNREIVKILSNILS